jgi:hypothetical protein
MSPFLLGVVARRQISMILRVFFISAISLQSIGHLSPFTGILNSAAAGSRVVLLTRDCAQPSGKPEGVHSFCKPGLPWSDEKTSHACKGILHGLCG